MKKENFKYQLSDLRMKQSLDLGTKEIFTRQAIRDFYNYFDGQIYVSISGGKDSEVLLDLVRKYYPDVPAVFVQTGLEYKEVRKRALMHDNVTVLRPQKSHFEVLSEYGYPLISKDVSQVIWGARHSDNPESRKHYLYRLDGLNDNGEPDDFRQMYKKYKFLLDAPFEISSFCCNFLKENSCREYEKEHDLHPVVGLMAEESERRQSAWLKTGCNAFNGRGVSKPLSVWLKKDILLYLHNNEENLRRKDMDFIKRTSFMTEKEYNEMFPHPWAKVYGDIVPEFSKEQLDGQVDLFTLTNQTIDGCDWKTTGCDRTGCQYCLYGAQCHGDKRLLRLKENEPDIYDFIMRGGKFNDNGMWVPDKGLGFKFVIDWMKEHGGVSILY